MSRVDEWWSEDPRRPPAEYAVELAKSRLFRDARRFTTTSPDVEAAAPLLELDERFAHAFVLVLSQLPAASRGDVASRFYAERRAPRASAPDSDSRAALAVAAGVALLVVELADRQDLSGERMLDLLHGAAQGDDVSNLPEPALAEIRKAIARTRLDLAVEDEDDPAAAAATVVAEVLDPSTHVVPLQEIFARAAWAALRSWEPSRVLEFLLEVDQMLVRSDYQPQARR